VGVSIFKTLIDELKGLTYRGEIHNYFPNFDIPTAGIPIVGGLAVGLITYIIKN
jgi:hypothetical protein